MISKATLTRYSIILLMLAFSVASAFAQTVSLDINTDDFLNQTNIWIPLAVAIVSIGVGIRLAFGLAEYIGGMLGSVFKR